MCVISTATRGVGAVFQQRKVKWQTSNPVYKYKIILVINPISLGRKKRISLQFMDTVSHVKSDFLCPLLESSVFSSRSCQMKSCELFWSNSQPLNIQASANISPYFSFFAIWLSSFLPPQSTQAFLFLKTIGLNITPDLNFLNNAEYHPVVSTGERIRVQRELQDISQVTEQYNFCTTSKRTVTIGKWQCHCHFVEGSRVCIKQRFKGTTICKTEVTQPGFQTWSLQIPSFNWCSCCKFY